MFANRLHLSNLPFTLKFVIAPGVAVALMCVVAYVGSSGLDRQVDQTRMIVDRNMEGAIRMSDIATRVQIANGELYRLMTRQAAGGTGAEVAQKITALQDQIGRIVADLGAYRDGYAGEDERPKVEAVVAELTKYKDATTFVASMLEIDFASVVSFMAPFEANFLRLSEQMNAMVARAADDSRRRAGASADEASRTRSAFLAVTGIGALIVALLAWAVARNTAVSIGRIAGATLTLARGDTEVDIDRLARGDELGAIVESLVTFRQNIVQVHAMQAEQERMRKESELERHRSMAELADSFEASVKRVVQAVSGASSSLKSSASGMRETADGAYHQSSEVAQAGAEMSGNVTTVATAVEEMSSSINEIARQIEQSAKIAGEAVERARQTDETMKDLADLAKRIGDIVSMIHGIAGQTNLLALNATIEAARAGDAGRGFAVVASEVKSLATQTGGATEDISAQIAAIQERTDRAVNAIRGISETIEQMNAITSAIAASVDEQAAAAREISRSVQNAATNTESVSRTIDAVRDAARTVGQTADGVLGAAHDMTHQAQALEAEVDNFLLRVRA